MTAPITTPPTTLGRFLEISVHAPELLASLAFYESLGFQQIAVNEVRSWPYGVVTDGRLFLGLHQRPIESPTLTFVQADLARHAATLRHQGIVFTREHLGGDEFNEVSFQDPHGQHVQLIEARTFSPPSTATDSSCGYFVEYGLPVREFEIGIGFWEALGFVAMQETSEPFPRRSLTSNHLNLGLHRSRALRQPMLVFESDDMRERLSALRERGFILGDDMPDTLDEQTNAVLTAPEGTKLLLMQLE